MRVLLLGATGMVGTAVLRMLQEDSAVTEVLVVGRRKLWVLDCALESSDINRLGGA